MTAWTAADRKHYQRQYARVVAARTLLDEMVDEYPEPDRARDAGQTAELRDLADVLERLTFAWVADKFTALQNGA